MKKLHLGFSIAALAVLAAGIVHGGIAWLVASLTWDPMETSFPAWSMFAIVMMFYLLAVAVVLLAWLFTWLLVRAVKKRRLQSG